MELENTGLRTIDHKSRIALFQEKIRLSRRELLEEASLLSKLEYKNDAEVSPREIGRALEKDGLMTFYGMSCMLRSWLGLEDEDLAFGVPHGISFNKSVVKGDHYPGRSVAIWQHTYACRYRRSWGFISTPAVLYLPPPMFIIRALRNIYTEDTHRSAEEVRCQTNGRVSRCLFVMPHTTHELGVEYEDRLIVERIRMLADRYDKVDCLVYFLDTMRLGDLRDYFSNVYCCGHALDPGFLARLYAVIDSCDALSYLEIGTTAYHAASLEKEVIHCNHIFEVVNISNKKDRDACYVGLDAMWIKKLAGKEDDDICSILRMGITVEEDLEECRLALLSLQSDWRARIWALALKRLAKVCRLPMALQKVMAKLVSKKGETPQ